MNVGTYAFAQILRVLPRAQITRAVGRLCDMTLPPAVSRAVVRLYTSAYRVDLGESQPPDRAGAYPSFDAFFTRRLRNGVRASAAPSDAVVSPADGRLDAVGRVEPDGLIVVKGWPYRTADLLGDEVEAQRYQGGQYACIYLSPRDYHRVHAPVGGTLREVRSYPGDLFPVNGVSEAHIPGYLARNRRAAIVIDAGRAGTVTVVMVAAMIVGRISVTGIDARDVPRGRHEVAAVIDRGDEMGVFHLGSTVVLFTEPRRVPDFDRPVGRIRIGQALTVPATRSGGRA